MPSIFQSLLIAFLAVGLIATTGCKKHYIRDVDPSVPGRVRSTGPESQDVQGVADQMMRSLLRTPVIRDADRPPTIAVLPMDNNTRFAFNSDVYNTLLKARLNSQAHGRMVFVGRDVLPDIIAEREAKRTGTFDYDPAMRSQALAGADYFLVGRVDGLSTASTRGQADYLIYAYKLVDAENSIEVWEDYFETKREGRDDVLYR